MEFKIIKFFTLFLFVILFECSLFQKSSRPNIDVSGKDISSFYFVQVSDTHIGDSINNIRTDSIIESINRLSVKPDFVLITGDIFYNPPDSINSKAAYNKFSKLNIPFVFTPGNHDISYKPDSVSFSRYKQVFGNPDTTFIWKKVRFVGFNSCWMTENKNPQADSTFLFLSNSLKTDSLSKIIFTHIPPTLNFFNNQINTTLIPIYQNVIDSLINMPDANVKAVITGHFHRDELQWDKKIPVYIAGPVARNLGRPATYRLYKYENGKLSYYTIYLE